MASQGRLATGSRDENDERWPSNAKEKMETRNKKKRWENVRTRRESSK